MRFLDSPSRGFAFLGRFGWNRLSGGPLPCLSGTLHHPLVAFVLWPWLTVWSCSGQRRERVIFVTALLLTGHLLFRSGRLTSPSSTPRSGSRGGHWSSTTSPCSFLFLFILFKFFECWHFFLLHAKVRNTLVTKPELTLLYLIPEYDHLSFYSYLYQVLFHSTYRLLTLMAVGYQLYQ